MIARILRGGRGDSPVIMFPEFVAAYETVAHGWADEIRPAEGETARRVTHGSPDSFAVWVVGAADVGAAE